MKKILTFATMFLLCLSTFSMLLPNALANGLVAPYSTNLPVIDGSVTDPEWNDAYNFAAWLKGPTDVLSHIYFKHDGTNIYIGIKVFGGQHSDDKFVFCFDEGDDGGYGSGTRDGVLTPDQEDLKVYTSVPSPFPPHTNTLDGYISSGAWVTHNVEIDFDAECIFVVDHWEGEFSIPFVGNDGGTHDRSDLVCTVADTIGIKIQYFTGENYYFPAGDMTEIETYATLSFLPPAHVIPEVPLGTIVASAAMIIALAAYVAVPKWRRKQK